MNSEQASVFMTRLKFKTATGEFPDMISLRVNCYRFRFKRPLSEKEQYAFLEYAEAMDLAEIKSVLAMAIWLGISKIPYDIGFAYNKDLSPLRNLRYLFYLRTIRKEARELAQDILKKLEGISCQSDAPNVEVRYSLLQRM